MGTTADKVTLGGDCPACGKPVHLAQETAGGAIWIGWMHDSAADEHACWTANRSAYEDGIL
jgi:hypothetical protein